MLKAKGNAARQAGGAETDEALASYVKAIDLGGRSAPLKGWICELDDAKAALKTDASARNWLRLATAYLVLRQFQKGKKASTAGLRCIDICPEIRSDLKECLAVADEGIAEQSSYRSSADAFLQLNLRKISVNNSSAAGTMYTNINLLHGAALTGDLRLVENLLAKGAALDFPVSNNKGGSPAPVGTTALHFACMYLLILKLGTSIPSDLVLPGIDKRLADIAVTLVMCGADFAKSLEFPKRNARYCIFEVSDVRGKSSKDMAEAAGCLDVLKAMDIMERDPKERAWCRCGSRLPWKECHASPAVIGQYPHFIENTENRTEHYYRHSPTAVCQCGNTNKSHFECCWFSILPRYLDDVKGEYIGPLALPAHPGDLPKTILHRFGTGSSEGVERVADEKKLAEKQAVLIEMFRNEGPVPFFVACGLYSPKSRLCDWDKHVYAGILERIPSNRFFYWNDMHWVVDKASLIRRVKDWNMYLEAYCDDKGLTGKEREHVIRQHTANPLAPCGNLSCANWETRVKEYKSCSRCKTIAYCSRQCQVDHWKKHKKEGCKQIGL